ncbi:glycerophosphodiester phosphodiesterase [Akkermansiaceae bacterium]|nr:glycerophosphodiester phosphodiesterase [Akkermansiaceae bacterium]
MTYKLLLASLTCFAQVLLAGEFAPLVVAHRGASHAAPENTLSAFKLAWEEGADAIEGDFFLTSDQQIVCTHDRTIQRLNQKKVKLDVVKSTLEELQKLDVGSWKNEKWRGEKMPTLAEVMKTVPKGKRIYIEVKCGVEIVPFLKKEIESGGLEPKQIVIISFKKEVILKAKTTMPDLKAIWLCSFKRNKKTGEVTPSEAEVMKALAAVKADGLSCGDHDSLTEDFLKRVHSMGHETHCWTVNDPKRAKELAGMGMRSITTDRPAAIREGLGVIKAR